MKQLRDDLLAGRRLALGAGVGTAVSELLSRLGAVAVDARAVLESAPDSENGGAIEIDALILDAGGAFERGGDAALADSLQATWDLIAAAATRALIPGGGGKVIMIAPHAGAGRHAEAARAALENLARTLSVEWARYGITVTAITPGRTTTEDEVASLVAFLASVAGDYYSGCRFDLGAVG